jgi:signal transduction histidine kinase
MVTGLIMAALHALLHDIEMAWLREYAASLQLHQERDLLDQRVAERTRELAQARDQALAASHLKTELLAKVSHELRTPLGAILGFTEMLKEGVYGDIAPAQQTITTEIIDSTQYLTSLVNELLDQAQLDTGKLQLKISAFTPAALVDDILTRMNILAQAKGLALNADISSNVPATLFGDLTRLQQILMNLVSNAIKFTQQGRVQVSLFCPDPQHWAIQVADTGVGIPAEAQAYIFEPFRQVDGSVTRGQPGTGLGLSIVKQLTTLMGGQIKLKSEVGHGSIFTVILPLKSVQPQVV